MKGFILLLALLALPLLSPQIAFGADPGLVTCGYDGIDCNFCTFVEMVDRIIDFLFIILTLVAVAVMMFAGFTLVLSQGNTEARSKATGMLTNVVVGFVMVMAAWLIVDTIMKMLIDPDVGFGMWNEIGDCSAGDNATASSYSQGTYSSGSLDSDAEAGDGTDANGEADLDGAKYCFEETGGDEVWVSGVSQDTCEEIRQEYEDDGRNVPNQCYQCDF